MDLERWKNFSFRQQLMMIGAELIRARTWQNKDQDKFLTALSRALELIDLTLLDSRWRNNLLMILRLRDETAKFFCAERSDDILSLYRAL